MKKSKGYGNDELIHIPMYCSWGDVTVVTTPDGLGMCELILDKNYIYMAHLNRLMVHPDAQHEGLGTLLLHHAEGIARKWGMRYLRLAADVKKQWLVQWYEREGYEIVQRHEYEFTMRKKLEIELIVIQ